MKKIIAILIIAMLVIPSALAEINFDISVFEEAGLYDIEFDDMDDTGMITLKEGGIYLGLPSDEDASEGFLLGNFGLAIIEGEPPVIGFTMMYSGEDWIFTDKVILKPGDTRYTFEVDPDTDVSDGTIQESFLVVITDESFSLIEDIIESGGTNVRCRLSGDQNVDFEITFDKDVLAAMCEHYKASGALDNDFSTIKRAFPCTIK